MRSSTANEAPLVVFLHIPKTGGSTVRDHLRRSFRPEETLLWYGHENYARGLNGIDDARLAGKRLLAGHLDFGVHARTERPVEYLTLLREPVERLCSLYEFTRTRDPGRTDIPDFIEDAQHLSLLEFVEKHPGLHDGQTRVLAGNRRTDLHKARQNLERTFAGVQEHTNAFVAALTEKLGLRRRPIIWKKANARRTPCPPAEREALAAFCAKDLALYEHAKRRFAAALEEMGLDPALLENREPLASRLWNAPRRWLGRG